MSYDQARGNAEYWNQWARNLNNIALQQCKCCTEWAIPHSSYPHSPPVHLRDQKFCLDCHGSLQEIAPYVFRCESCKVIHGISGGNSSPYARFHRSGLLKFRRGGIEYDFSETCVLSSYWPFEKWLRRRHSRS